MTIDVNKKYMLTGGQIEDLASRLALTGEEVADKAEKAQTGSTAPTTSTPGEIGQLYIQSDGTVYILKSIVEESGQPDEYTWEEVGGGGASYTAGDGIDITNDVIKATNTGKAKELTSADYNYPAANPDGVAMWLLDEGIYTRSSSVKVYLSTRRIVDTQYQEFIITPAELSGGTPVMGIVYLSHANPIMYYAVVNTNGVEIGSPVTLLTSGTISQSTGTSTTSVMSQNATTSMVFADPGTKQKVQIGAGSGAGGNASVATGMGASASYDGSIALGAYTRTSAPGEMNIGTSITAYGYNSSNYRLLTGLYDPQSAHDAATKGYVDTAVAGAGASAFTTNEWNALWA